jgi:hypothetical protein
MDEHARFQSSEYPNNAPVEHPSALAAAPVDYGVTGVKIFIISHDGVVCERDLGPTTLDHFRTMKRFNPDSSWKPVAQE